VEGGLFFALKGERFDAHQHLESAVSGGAGGLVVSNPDALPGSLPPGCLVAVVEDTREALGALGHYVRGLLSGPVVAITGSVGKTTVKDMCAAALSAFGEVGRSPGNWNNEIGVPLSLLSLTGQESSVVLELGMSAPGEIATLTRIAAPSVGVVTSAVAAHLAFFESVDGIADAKAELLEELPSTGRAVVCADDPRILARGRRLRPDDLLTYGVSDTADVRVTSVSQDRSGLDVTLTLEGRQVQVRVPTLGRHNAVNAAGALAIVHALGHPVEEAATSLSRHFRPSAHRLEVHQTDTGLVILDDCYNANPTSTRAALETLGEISEAAPARGAVIGSMLELGPSAEVLHQEIGEDAARVGLHWLGTTGPHAAAVAQGARGAGMKQVYTADDAMELLGPIEDFADHGRWLLLKGSRGQRLERLLGPLGVGGMG